MGADIHERAAQVFGARHGEICWPYGISSPDRLSRRRDPELYEKLLAGRLTAQRLIVEWAERYGLKTSESGCCPRWLRGKVSRRCSPTSCTYGGADHRWLDHGVFWLKGGRPVAITSAPYHLGVDDESRLSWWLDEDPRFRVAHGTGWYGYGTRQVLLWRVDRIEQMEPAEP